MTITLKSLWKKPGGDWDYDTCVPNKVDVSEIRIPLCIQRDKEVR